MVECAVSGNPQIDKGSRRWVMKKGLSTLTGHLQGKLGPHFSGDLAFDDLSLALYSNDASIYQIKPSAVAFPRNRDDLTALVELAREEGLPLTARGGGSGLCGGALGRGLIVEFNRYLNRIERIDPKTRAVTVEPGIILDRLNRELQTHGMMLGPDPASSAVCTVGGMIAHNASGAHSLRYGDTRKSILGLEVLLSDGTRLQLDGWQAGGEKTIPDPLPAVKNLLNDHTDVIASGYPQTKRNSAGYLLRDVLEEDRFRPALLFAASEGTLGFTLSATFRAEHIPAHKVLVLVCFRSVVGAAAAVPDLLTFRPAAVEMLDNFLHRFGAEHVPGFQKLFPPAAGASLLIEFSGRNRGAVEEALEAFNRRFASPGEQRDMRKIILHPEEQASVWKIRKAAVPLLARRKGKERPVPFIEDAAVPPEKLAEYARRVDEILTKRKIPYATYAHAGAGELHFRPFMLLDTDRGKQIFSQVAEEVFDLVLSLGGTIAGEHGTGLGRAGYLEKQYGPLLPVFRSLKKIFDASGIMNPGRPVTGEKSTMTSSMRPLLTGKGLPSRAALFPGREDLIEDLSRCDGCGLCKSMDREQRMCPVYHALRREEASPRGKNILLQHFLSGDLSEGQILSERFKDVLDLCLNCGMCTKECPAVMDVSALMALVRRYVVLQQGKPILNPLLQTIFARAEMGAAIPGIANFFLTLPGMRRLLEYTAGYDRRAPVPGYRQKATDRLESPEHAPDFLCFLDTFSNCFDTGVARAIQKLGNATGETPVFPDQRGSGLPLINAGSLEEAKALCRFNLEKMNRSEWSDLPIVVPEPSAVLALREEYPSLLGDGPAQRVAARIVEAGHFFAEKLKQGQTAAGASPERINVVYHMPCHMKLIAPESAGLWILRQIKNLGVIHLEQGCCGMGGTFGLKRGSYDLSQEIGAPLFSAIRKEVPDLIASECSACRIQLQQATGIRAVHPLEILAASIPD